MTDFEAMLSPCFQPSAPDFPMRKAVPGDASEGFITERECSGHKHRRILCLGLKMRTKGQQYAAMVSTFFLSSVVLFEGFKSSRRFAAGGPQSTSGLISGLASKSNKRLGRYPNSETVPIKQC